MPCGAFRSRRILLGLESNKAGDLGGGLFFRRSRMKFINLFVILKVPTMVNSGNNFAAIARHDANRHKLGRILIATAVDHSI